MNVLIASINSFWEDNNHIITFFESISDLLSANQIYLVILQDISARDILIKTQKFLIDIQLSREIIVFNNLVYKR